MHQGSIILNYVEFHCQHWRGRVRGREGVILSNSVLRWISTKQGPDLTVRDVTTKERATSEFVDKYLSKECVPRRIAGPFSSHPLSVPLVVSPMNTVPKSNGDEFADLSMPIGMSVNVDDICLC